MWGILLRGCLILPVAAVFVWCLQFRDLGRSAKEKMAEKAAEKKEESGKAAPSPRRGSKPGRGAVTRAALEAAEKRCAEIGQWHPDQEFCEQTDKGTRASGDGGMSFTRRVRHDEKNFRIEWQCPAEKGDAAVTIHVTASGGLPRRHYALDTAEECSIQHFSWTSQALVHLVRSPRDVDVRVSLDKTLLGEVRLLIPSGKDVGGVRD